MNKKELIIRKIPSLFFISKKYLNINFQKIKKKKKNFKHNFFNLKKNKKFKTPTIIKNSTNLKSKNKNADLKQKKQNTHSAASSSNKLNS